MVSTRTNGTEKLEANNAEARLLGSALTLFSEQGYDGTSIREIIEKAGVTRPVLYYYFENKEDLFCKLVESKFREMTEHIDTVYSAVSGCRDRLKLVISAAFERAEQVPEVIRLILQVFFSPPKESPKLDKQALAQARFERLAAIMKDGLDRGELAGGTPETLALAFAGYMDIYTMAKSHQPGIRLSKELGNWLVDLFMEGAQQCSRPEPSLVNPFAEVS